MTTERPRHEQIRILYLDGHTWRQLPAAAELIAGYHPRRSEDPGQTGARIVADIVAHMRTSPVTELGARWRDILAGRSWCVDVYAGHLRDFPELYWPAYPTQADRHAIRDEQWTTSQVADRLGIGRTEVGRTLDRWGVAPVGRGPGRTGENLYDPQAVCHAIATRPRRGRTTAGKAAGK